MARFEPVSISLTSSRHRGELLDHRTTVIFYTTIANDKESRCTLERAVYCTRGQAQEGVVSRSSFSPCHQKWEHSVTSARMWT